MLDASTTARKAGLRSNVFGDAAGVSDTGRGIPMDKLERIFDPFVRVDTGFARQTEGTGLGLSISRNLARAMGGELTASSDAGDGSRFSLQLPAVRV